MNCVETILKLRDSDLAIMLPIMTERWEGPYGPKPIESEVDYVVAVPIKKLVSMIEEAHATDPLQGYETTDEEFIRLSSDYYSGEVSDVEKAMIACVLNLNETGYRILTLTEAVLTALVDNYKKLE